MSLMMMIILLPFVFYYWSEMVIITLMLNMMFFIMTSQISSFSPLMSNFFMTNFMPESLFFMSSLIIFISILSIHCLNYNNSSFMVSILITIYICFFLVFFSNKLFNFYIFFELILLPMFIMIMGWGYQMERLSASLALLFYTIISSGPLMLSIIIIMKNANLMWFSQFLFLDSFKILEMKLIHIFMISAFLVKTPMFLVHLWLPKAHVEAPMVGSMILAAILLKLGGVGLFRMLPLMMFNKFMNLIISISLMGALISSIICIQLIDMKILIAYSSVSHMGILLAALFCFNKIGLLGGSMLMISHGFSSSAMFMKANLFYVRSNSRSLLITKGFSNLSPSITLMWFVIIMMNMSSPPTLNFFAELMSILGIICSSIWNLLPISFITFFTMMYSIIVYSNVSHSSFFFSNSYKFTMLEYFMIMFHIYWGMLGCMIIQLMP